MWATQDACLRCGCPEHLHALTCWLRVTPKSGCWALTTFGIFLALCHVMGITRAAHTFKLHVPCFGCVSSDGAANMSPRGSRWYQRLNFWLPKSAGPADMPVPAMQPAQRYPLPPACRLYSWTMVSWVAACLACQ